MFKVQVDHFEGPLDLLLQLIEKEKLDITKISLGKITDEYLSVIPTLDAKSHDLAEFVLVASKLLYIKSRALLPTLETREEEEEIDDLEEKLKEYRKYKEVAEKFHKTLQKGLKSFKTGVKAAMHYQGFVAPQGIEINDLMDVLKDVLKETDEKEEEIEKVFHKLITVEEKRFELEKHIIKKKKVSFRELLKKAKNKHEIVVSFLAILDLIKQKTVRVKQDENFGDIMIETTEIEKNVTKNNEKS